MNTYDETDRNWSTYAMRGASRRLARLMPVTHRSGDRANLAAWHQTFDPVNRSGLVMINSHGEPNRFGLVGGYGLVGDMPQTEPAAVLMVHSFSAADPSDPNTVAGRWLANGAFVFFGSMHEPFLAAFRTPELVATLIEEGMPLVAAMRPVALRAAGRTVEAGLHRRSSLQGEVGNPAFPASHQRTGRPEPPGLATPVLPGLRPTPRTTARLTWAVKTAVGPASARARRIASRQHRRCPQDDPAAPTRARLDALLRRAHVRCDAPEESARRAGHHACADSSGRTLSGRHATAGDLSVPDVGSLPEAPEGVRQGRTGLERPHSLGATARHSGANHRPHECAGPTPRLTAPSGGPC